MLPLGSPCCRLFLAHASVHTGMPASMPTKAALWPACHQPLGPNLCVRPGAVPLNPCPHCLPLSPPCLLHIAVEPLIAHIKDSHTSSTPFPSTSQIPHHPPPVPPALKSLLPSATADSVYGSFPPAVLDPLIEHLKDAVESNTDLEGAQRSLSNAFTLYCKTRPAASTESSRRAKSMPPEGMHPLLAARTPRTRMTG